MKRYHLSKKILIFVFILLTVLVVSGVVVWQYLKLKTPLLAENKGTASQDKVESRPEPSPEPVDLYQGWQTYTSQRDGYELKYPADWIVIGETANDGPYIRNMQFTGGGYPEGYINLRVLRDEGIVPGSNLSPQEWYAQLGVATVKKGPVTFTPDTVEQYTLNGLEVKKAKSIFSEIDEDIFLLRKGVLYEINMYPYGISQDAQVQKILNSVRFL